MKERDDQLGETLKQIGIRSILLAVAVLFIVIGIAAYVGNRIYATEKKVLQQQGELNAKEAAMEYNNCLLTRANIITLVCCGVENMLTSGEGNDAIEKYITEQTQYVNNTLDPSTTGIYGWVNRGYIDGAGWVPDEDFVPTERPWYKQTLASDAPITFVEPYLDMKTNTTMMTVAQLLSDGESVIAMDVSLAPLQEIVEKVASATEGSLALVLDESGAVITHSDADQQSKNFLDDPDSYKADIARKILEEGQTQFDIKTDEGNYSVYVDELPGNWYSVNMINSDIWYRPLRHVMITFAVILLLLVTFIIFVFLRLNSKNQTLQELLTQIDQEEKRGKEWKALSETDRMTGLYDRVSGKNKIDGLLSLGMKGTFFVLDINRFKSINDTCGHQAGDIVIIAMADALRSSFRSNDIIMRLGGDEFCAFAVGTTEQERANEIISRLFSKLEKLSIPELKGKKFTVSVGAAFSSGEEDFSFETLYGKADAALYESKKAFGNNLIITD